jgi:hypothetical protein
MMKKNKTVLIIFVCLSIIASSVGVNAIGLKKVNNVSNSESEFTHKTYTFYKHLPDGTVEPVEVDLEFNDDTDLGQLLEEKCQEIFDSEPEFKGFFKEKSNETKINITLTGDWGWLFVKSRGRGYHYKTKPLVNMFIQFSLFKLNLPLILFNIKRPLVFCRYPKDGKAVTTIKPMIRSLLGMNCTKTITGHHSVIVRKFVGITTWAGRVSFTPLDIFPKAFYGFARWVICNKLP